MANDTYRHNTETALVIANRQVEGRGRQGRTWVEPDRGLFSSLVFESEWRGADATLIPLCAAVAVADAIGAEADVSVDLKWPNDLHVDGRKVGGILVEVSGQRVTVGCGVNLWWASPPEFASAVFSADPGADVAERLAVAWSNRLLSIVAEPAAVWPRDEYVRQCVTLGSDVTWESGSGQAIGIGPDGSLIVATIDGNVEVRQGDVHLSANG